MSVGAPSRIGRLMLAAAVFAQVSCGGGGGGRVPRIPDSAPPVASASSPLQGEWTLVGLETASGPRKVTGFLRYDRFANITVRAELSGDDPTARPPRTVVADFTAKASPQGGELEYVGLQPRVDAERLAQDTVRMDEWRVFEVAGDTLRLSVRGGGATLVFQRTP